MWTELDETKRLCQEWLRDPTVNPETGKLIKRNGPTYIKWRDKCKELGLASRQVSTKTLTWAKCQEWRRNPDINPDTGHKIKRDGPTYKWLCKECQNITEPVVNMEGEYYAPDKNGMVPCVTYNGHHYVARKFNGRKVYGPRNKPARRITLQFYKDTWDYIHEHYKPIFIGVQPKRVQRPHLTKTKKLNSSKNKSFIDNILNVFENAFTTKRVSVE